jgi:hypothetical protein
VIAGKYNAAMLRGRNPHAPRGGYT